MAPSVADPDGVIEEVRRRFHIAWLLERLVRGGAVGLWAVGVAILIVKAGGWHDRLPWSWFFLALIPACGVACLFRREQRFSSAEVAAWLDWKTRGGGRWIARQDGMASLPRADGDDLPLPRPLGLAMGPLLGRLALPALFAAATLILPGRVGASTLSAAGVRSKARRVQARVERARRLEVLREPEVAALAEGLDRALDRAELAPESAAEAVDRMGEQLDRKLLRQARIMRDALEAARAVQRGALAGEDLAAGERLASALAQAMADEGEDLSMSPATRRRLRRLLQKHGALPGAPPGASAQAGGALSAEQLKGLTKELEREFSARELEELADRLADLAEKGLRNCQRSASGTVSERMGELMATLAAAACGCEAGLSGKPCPAGTCPMGGAPRPGQGGVSRGRGDAPLTFGEETDTSGLDFTPVVLDHDETPLPGVLVGRGRLAAEVIPPAEFRPTGASAVELGDSTGGRDSGLRLGPRNRKAAARFFSDGEPGGP